MLKGSLWAILPAALAMLALRLSMPSQISDDENETPVPAIAAQPA
jgi:hypothetical protein